jgi:hypothetical protein
MWTLSAAAPSTLPGSLECGPPSTPAKTLTAASSYRVTPPVTYGAHMKSRVIRKYQEMIFCIMEEPPGVA